MSLNLLFLGALERLRPINDEDAFTKPLNETAEIMQSLTIKDFSCIKIASIETARLTIIIGPQASGKSVISKLLYFCTSMVSDFSKNITDDKLPYDKFVKRVGVRFSEWFPETAWGAKRFTISYVLGDFKIDISRVGKSEKIRVKFCDDFEEIYRRTSEQCNSLLRKASDKDDEYDYELTWKLRNIAIINLRRWIGSDMIDNQMFIPAGRSFFTSVGKALVAFEHSGFLDPVTLEFGRRFSLIKDRQSRRIGFRGQESGALANRLFQEILGGRIKIEGGKEFVKAEDGRMIPFSALSSGQQELLPLAVAIRAMLPTEDRTPARSMARRFIFIEEPEAHLFPRAQNQLIEILASLVSRRKLNSLLLTTHSPYVLSKINNLIKAGEISRSKNQAVLKSLAAIVPETSWLPPKTVSAYAIVDGRLERIIDSSGLVDGDYLDEVSGDIAREFSGLLSLEFS